MRTSVLGLPLVTFAPVTAIATLWNQPGKMFALLRLGLFNQIGKQSMGFLRGATFRFAQTRKGVIQLLPGKWLGENRSPHANARLGELFNVGTHGVAVMSEYAIHKRRAFRR